MPVGDKKKQRGRLKSEMLEMKDQLGCYFGDLIGDTETGEDVEAGGILSKRDHHQWCSTTTWQGIPSFAMELLSKHVNQSEIRIFEAKSEALAY